MRRFINIIETAENPHLETRDGELHFVGFGVDAVITGEPDVGCSIYEFTSSDDGKGNGTKAIRWLKAHFGYISVIDPGTPEKNPESYGFWKQLYDQGLIDRMEYE